MCIVQTVAQHTIAFDTVTVQETKLRSQNLGSITLNASAEKLSEGGLTTMDQWLNKNSLIYLRSNGPSSSSTLSARGSTGSQFLVNWNGIPIQQFQLGVFDLSLIPISGIDQVELVKGGGSSLWGSGAIGGVLECNNKAISGDNDLVNLRLLMGSFGRRRIQANIGWKENNWGFASYLMDEKVDNDFSYSNEAFSVSGIQSNARKRQSSFLQSIYYSKDDRHFLNFHAWLQSTSRQIPPNLQQNSSSAYQKDWASRWMMNYTLKTGNLNIESKMAYFRERLDYFDPRILLRSLSTLDAKVFELNMTPSKNSKLPWVIGYAYRHHKVFSNVLEGDQKDQIQALFGSLRWNPSRWQLQLSSRVETQNNGQIHPVFSFGGEYQFENNWKGLFKISRNFRLPTINDRYFNPGGNPDLLPEKGWSQELSCLYQSKFNMSLSLFNRNLHNGLIWARLDGENFFSSHNLTELWTRGIEFSFDYPFNFQSISLVFSNQASFLKSTNQVSLNSPKIDKGQQLIYTPEIKTNNSLRLYWKSMSWSIHYQYISGRDGISAFLDPYALLDLRYKMVDIPFYSGRMQIGLNIDNVLNQYYESIEFFPMPGRNYSFEVNFKF